ncbi:MAG: hypothetical protein ACP5PQ_07430 [Thermoproteota archaeon]
MDFSAFAAAITILFLAMFLLMFAMFFFSFVKWWRSAPVYHYPPIRVEDYSCPKCGSKELELVGKRTLRCRKCGTTFTINPVCEERWVVWPFLWWFPVVWPIAYDR